MKAEIDIAGIDVSSALREFPIDVTQLEELIAKKYDLKKQKALYLGRAVASLKSILSEDQYEKLKDLWSDKKSS